MKTLLHIDSSTRAGRSCSRRLTAYFAQQWQLANPDGTIIHREVGLTPLPLVSEEWVAAAFSSPDGHTPGQRAAITVSNELVDELVSADEVLIGAPMYNFTITASLKAWIDQIVRVGRTVAYPSFTGLLRNKKATIIATCGGAGLGPSEPMAHLNALSPYLRQILSFIGISDISVVHAGNLATSDEARESNLSQAMARIEELVRPKCSNNGSASLSPVSASASP